MSWVRSRDSHILSVDTTVFVSDPRVVIIQNKIRGEWTLIGKCYAVFSFTEAELIDLNRVAEPPITGLNCAVAQI